MKGGSSGGLLGCSSEMLADWGVCGRDGGVGCEQCWLLLRLPRMSEWDLPGLGTEWMHLGKNMEKYMCAWGGGRGGGGYTLTVSPFDFCEDE